VVGTLAVALVSYLPSRYELVELSLVDNPGDPRGRSCELSPSSNHRSTFKNPLDTLAPATCSYACLCREAGFPWTYFPCRNHATARQQHTRKEYDPAERLDDPEAAL